MSICLKELRESNITLEIMDEANLLSQEGNLKKIQNESNELTAIFKKSIMTAKENSVK